jgi:hypothetical protein
MHRPEIRRAAERGLIRTDWLEGWCSFSFGPYQRRDRDRFGALRVLNEDWVAPDRGFALHPHDNLEILLMPLQSVTAHADSLGHRVDVRPDELLLMRAGRGIRHSQMNASRTERDHHLQIWLLPRRRDAEPALLHQRFAPAGRDNRWELWASGAGEPGVPAVDADVRVHRARLAPGRCLEAASGEAHSAYLHVGTGRIRLWTDGQQHELAAGDALAWSQVGGLRVEALAPAELLYVEQAPLTP